MAAPQTQVQQQSSTHMMKTTRSGRPFVKDIHDLFSTLIVSLPMETHRNLFKSYSNSFTTEEAIANLGSLRFTQSHRTPDAKDPSRIITTTTTTTFSMTKEMAKSVCQTFMDARLFESLGDSSSRAFKDKNIYGLTPKGLYILERFINKNGITAPHLSKLLNTHSSSPQSSSLSSSIKLYLIERSPDNDSVVLSRQNIESIFRRFVGQRPNISNNNNHGDHSSTLSIENNNSNNSNGSIDRNLGIEVKERQINQKVYRYTFTGASACDWLREYTTLITKEEAMKIAVEFVRYGFIECVSSSSSSSASYSSENPSFRYSKSTYYQILEEGKKIASWNDNHYYNDTNNIFSNGIAKEKLSPNNLDNNNSGNNNNNNSNNNDDSNNNNCIGNNNSSSRSHSHASSLNSNFSNDVSYNGSTTSSATTTSSTTSNTKKLQLILNDTTLCKLFMEFLKANFCEENLMFLLDVQKFKLKCENLSDENIKDQQDLIIDAFKIYNTYLAQASPNELNIDHGLRQNVIQYMTSLITKDHQDNNDNILTQIKITSQLYDKIQDTIFRLMASDSIPKFVKTEKYLSASQNKSNNNNGDGSEDRYHRSIPSSSSTNDAIQC